jgi:hypothetical protein
MDSFSLLSHPTAAPTGLAILLVLLALIYRTSTRPDPLDSTLLVELFGACESAGRLAAFARVEVR